MRATFFHSMRQDWHTLLNPQLKRSMTINNTRMRFRQPTASQTRTRYLIFHRLKIQAAHHSWSSAGALSSGDTQHLF
jgi:hypothetical protein